MAANGFCWGIGLAPNWNAGGATDVAVCPTLDPAVKLKLGAELAEKENGFAVLSLLLLLLLLLPLPNWKADAAGGLFTVELEPNSNIFFDCGSSPVTVAADAPPPNGLLDPKAGGTAPNTGATDELDAGPNAGADGVVVCPKIDPEALLAGAGDIVPKVLEPNVGVALVALLVADPKLPN